MLEKHAASIFRAEDGGGTFFPNMSQLLLDYRVSHFRRKYSSTYKLILVSAVVDHYINSVIWECSGRSVLLYSIHKKSDKTDCNNYSGISLLSTSYNILSNILLSRLSPYIDEIIGDHQCGFQCNRSTTDQIFSIRQILERKWEYNETVHQLFVDFKKAYESVKREVLYTILI
jgi:hypothetical protein